MLLPLDERPLWVFGYGSLIWKPDFPTAEQQVARLNDWHRSFFMLSIHHRGTEAHPGLVLALDAAEGAYCDGLAFRVAPGHEEPTIAALRERELISSAYLETLQPLRLRDGRAIRALTYVIDPLHVQYCGGLSLDRQAEMIASAEGKRGPNCDYLYNTADYLHQLGIADDDLSQLAQQVRALRANAQR